MNTQTSNKNIYSKLHGKRLLSLARGVIAAKLGIKTNLQQPSELMEELKEDLFEQNMGVFVTLHLNKKLRGCIGSLESIESVKEGVKQNAINAAFNDPRFPPLTPEEFNKIHIDISVLSQPERLDYSNSDELLLKLEPEIHGVIISKGRAKATFLPQVWKQLPDKSLFLSHLCRKAGLSDHEWKNSKLDVMVYTVQCFEE